MAKSKVWRHEPSGLLYHDACFETEETQAWRMENSYVTVALAELQEDDECDSCDGVFLSGLTPLEDDDDDEVEPEDEQSA